MLGYRPNIIARSLIKGKSSMIGLVVSSVDHLFYSMAIARLLRKLQQRSYRVLLNIARDEKTELRKAFSDLVDYRVEGIIAVSVGVDQSLIETCEVEGIPLLLFNRCEAACGLSSVTTDLFEGARKVARFLGAGGHSRVCHIAGRLATPTGQLIRTGFEEGLQESGLSVHACVEGQYRRRIAAEATIALFAQQDQPPDAIFVAGDQMALGVLDALRDTMRVAVPEEVSVVGFDDIPLAGEEAYNLTTYRQPIHRMVDAAVTEILARISNPNLAASQVQISGELVTRGTSRTPGGGFDAPDK